MLSIVLALVAALAPTPAQKLGFPPVKPGPVPVVARPPIARRAQAAGTLDEPLSDLGAAVVDGKAYLVGG
jgi:hypothetical protein